MSLIVMEAHIGAMSQIVILVIWFGYVARHPSGDEGLLHAHGGYYLSSRWLEDW